MTIIAQIFAWCEAVGTQTVRRKTVYLCGGDATGKPPVKRLDTAICWETAAWIAQHGRSTPAASPPQRYNTLDLAHKVGVPKGAAAPFGILQ